MKFTLADRGEEDDGEYGVTGYVLESSWPTQPIHVRHLDIEQDQGELMVEE